MIGCCQLLLLDLCKYPELEQSLIGRSCHVIDLVHFSAIPRLGNQLHHWLEEINIEAKQVVNSVQRFQSCSGVIAVIID